MITLKENEKILMTLHKHWLIIAGRLIFILTLGVIPLAGFFLTDNTALLIFALALWWLTLLLLFFIEWLDYFSQRGVRIHNIARAGCNNNRTGLACNIF